MLGAGVAGAFLAPLASLLSQAVGEPVASFPWTNLAGVWVGTVVAVRMVDDAPWSSVGLSADAWRGRRLVDGFALGALLILAVAGVLYAGGFLRFERVPDLLDPLSAVGGQSSVMTWSADALRLLVLLAPAALAEELVFRGYLWTVAKESWGARVALWGTSVLFGVVHLSNPGAGVRTTLLVVLAGLALGTLRQRSDSLPAAWVAHLAWNWIMAAVLHVPVSGLPLASAGYRGVVVGPSWLTGGSWGPEGGAVAGAVMSSALIVALGRRVRNREAGTPTRNGE